MVGVPGLLLVILLIFQFETAPKEDADNYLTLISAESFIYIIFLKESSERPLITLANYLYTVHCNKFC